MDNLFDNVKKCEPKHARKRTANKSTWKRVVAQKKRYESKGLPKFPKCSHNQKAFRCAKLTCQDVRRFHKIFYKCETKKAQDNFILKYCTVKKATNKRQNAKRKITTKYHIIDQRGQMIPVCQNTFLNALLVTKDRVKGIMSRFYKTAGSYPKENRGGDRKTEKFEAKKISVQWFIEKFKVQESHYCRSKTQRSYLPSELNIRKMWRMYNAERDTDLKVKQGFFRKIFNTNYNIGFGSPRTDVCSTCISLQELIKAESTSAKKNELMIKKRIYRLKYKSFYQILQEEQETIKTITFDCQKNQALPKLPDQSAYYSRQFSFYYFAIVEGNSKAKLNKENIYSYYWTEVAHNKGANEIVSAVYHYLQQATFANRLKVLRIVCDGCSGQNKNTAMIAMLGKWLYSEAPRHIRKVEIIFPVVGHSFIPPDRVFGKIEKVLRTKEVVTCPAEYVSFLEENCTVRDLTAITVCDWKKSYEPIIKPTTSWHFPFMKSKRFFLSRTITENIMVQGEINYKSEINNKGVITKNKNKITMIRLEIIQPNTIVPQKNKLLDVIKLLQKHFGAEWRDLPNLNYYKEIEERLLGVNMESSDVIIPEKQDDLCEHGFEDVDSHV